MAPIFKCLTCGKDIERSTKTFWQKKGHLMCSTCLDYFDKNSKENINFLQKYELKNYQGI